MVIHLMPRLPAAFSDLTRSCSAGSTCLFRVMEPIWSCSWRGLPSFRCHHRNWWALTPPFHHHHPIRVRLSLFCGTFLGVTPTGRYPAPCPAEFGLSSQRLRLWATIWTTSANSMLDPFQVIVKGLIRQGVGPGVLVPCYMIDLKLFES